MTGWRGNTPKSARCAVVSVDYALSPEAKFPQALEECAAVVRWVAANGEQWGLDPKRIAVGGDSAGGNLALGTALLLRDQHGPALRAILALYPVATPTSPARAIRHTAPASISCPKKKCGSIGAHTPGTTPTG